MSTSSKYRAISAGLVVLTFAFFMAFFTKMHPIVLFDTDSWYYAYYHRHPWPIWNFWNPTRVFPETFMPLVSLFSANVIYPITGDYFFSLTIGYAAAVSGAISLLAWMVFRHFRKEGGNPLECAALTTLFLIGHFLILRSDRSNNRYMLLTENTCTYFYYVLPNLLNCALVLWLADDSRLKNIFTPGNYVRKSAFLLLAYFCMFSNLWGSMISGIYAAAALLVALVKMKKNKKGWLVEYIKQNSTLIAVLAIWVVAQWFEFNGRRAADMKNLHFSETLRQTIDAAKPVLASVSYPFRWMAVILLVGGIGATLWKKRWKEIGAVPVILIVLPAVAVYLLLTCAVVNPLYITRPDTFYGLFFFVMLALLVAFGQMLRHLPWVKVLVPLCLAVLAFECNTDYITYRNSMYFNLSGSVCYQVDNDILQQLQTALDAGQSETVLYVPRFNTDTNWPIMTNKSIRKRIPLHLHKMGVLDKTIKITEIIPTDDKNKEFGIG